MEIITYLILYGVLPILLQFVFAITSFSFGGHLLVVSERLRIPSYWIDAAIIRRVTETLFFTAVAALYLKANKAVFTKKQRVNTVLFSLTTAISAIWFFFLSYFICSFDLFFGCNPKELFSIHSILLLYRYHFFSIFLFTASAVINKAKTDKVKQLGIVFVIIVSLVTPLWGIQSDLRSFQKEVSEGSRDVLMLDSLNKIQFVEVRVPETNISYERPTSWKADESLSWRDFEGMLETYPEDYALFVKNFEKRTSASYKDISSRYYIDLIATSQSRLNQFSSAHEFINECSPKEKCRLPSDVKELPNRIKYCETYNLDNERFKQGAKDQLSKFGAGVNEDRDRVFIASIGENFNYCFELSITAESQNRKEKAVENIALHILSSIKY